MSKKFDLNRDQKIIWTVAALTLIALFAAPVLGEYFLRILTLVLIYLILTTGLNIVSGYTGQFSLGQAGLFAVGAYTGAILAGNFGFPFWLCFVAAIVMGGLFGLILGFPSLRVSGHYLALITIGFGVIIQLILVEWTELSGGPLGMVVPRITIGNIQLNDVQMFYLILIICLITLIISNNLIRSKYGRAFSAIRDNPIAASCMGINLTRYKLLAFVISAVFAGAAGCLFAFYENYISPDTFSFMLSVTFIIMVVVGGMGAIAGPIIGTALMTILPEYLHGLQDYRLIFYGVILVAIVIILPKGLAGLIRSKMPGVVYFQPPDEINEEPIKTSHNANGKDLLVIDGVSKSFGGLQALNNICMNIRRGSVHSLIGPNGAGKTTMINIITGFYKPDNGRIVFNGQEIQGKSTDTIATAGIGRTFQNVQVFGGLTVIENVMVGTHVKSNKNIVETILKLAGSRLEEKKALDKAWGLLHIVGLADKANEMADSLSAGQQRLLEIARALAMDPALLLLDEPAAGLNETEISKLGEIIKEITKKEITVMLIEHHLDFVMNISDTVTVFNFGEKLAEGKPDEIQNNSEVIEAYIGKEVV